MFLPRLVIPPRRLLGGRRRRGRRSSKTEKGGERYEAGITGGIGEEHEAGIKQQNLRQDERGEL